MVASSDAAMKISFTLLALATLGASASAVELVVNGGFDTIVSEEAPPWQLSGVNRAQGRWPIVGNNNTFTGGHMPGRSLGLADYTSANDAAWQTINTAGYGTATLTYRVVFHDSDTVAGRDIFTLSFGGTVLETFDIGAQPGSGNDVYHVFNRTYDLTPYFDGTAKDLRFATVTDGSNFTASGTYLDDVSIQASPVPEPATIAALGLGALALLRRKRR